MIPYGRHHVDASDVRAVLEVLRGGWLSQGPRIEEFEKKFARTCGARYAVAVSSGTAGLHLAGLAGGLAPKTEAITSPLTFVATANAALYCGARPVFSDIERNTLNLDMAQAAKKVTARTRAVLPVHFAGYPCSLKEWFPFFKKRGIVVIEDACHALGSSSGGGPIGSCRFSDMAVFSFHPLKSITTGEGGMVTTHSERFYRALLRLRNHGLERDPARMSAWEGPWYYQMQSLGFNYRLTDFQCALGLSQLRKLPAFIKRRKQLAGLYLKELKGIPWIELPQAKLPAYLSSSAHHLFVVRLRMELLPFGRKELVERLRALGVGTQVHYIPVHRHPYYESLGYRKGLCPKAESEYEKLLSLPLFYEMKDSDLKKVVAALKVCA